MLQLITAAVAEGKRAPRYSLLLGNRTEGDILCREQLEEAAAAGAVDLHYTLDQPPADWPHFAGFIDAPMLESTMPPPGPETYVFCCGPPPMVKSAVAKLEARGIAYAQKFAKAAGKTWQSANDIDAPKTSIAAMAIRHNSGEVPAAPGGGTTAPLRGGGTL